MSENKHNEHNESEEIIFEEEVIAETDKIKKLKDDLKKCKSERQEYLDGWQRSQADCINIKKRFEDDRKSLIKFANSEFIEELLPVLDSFDMAMKDKKSWEELPENWRKGVEYIHTQFHSILENHKVKVLNPIGEKFDHNRHNSIGVTEVDSKDKHELITEVLQKGYEQEGKIIRPPNVKVGEYIG